MNIAHVEHSTKLPEDTTAKSAPTDNGNSESDNIEQINDFNHIDSTSKVSRTSIPLNVKKIKRVEFEKILREKKDKHWTIANYLRRINQTLEPSLK